MSKQQYRVQMDYPKYPNAADRNYLRERRLNILSASVSALGFFTAMVYFLSL